MSKYVKEIYVNLGDEMGLKFAYFVLWFFKKIKPFPVSLFIFFRSFQTTFYRTKTVYASGIRTRIIAFEGEHADHLLKFVYYTGPGK